MGKKLYKTLSKNDVGLTGSHQSGISIPKNVVEAGILPSLPKEILNPRITLYFLDEEGHNWEFQYIYYNDQFHNKERGKSHNEYRLTRVKNFLRYYNVLDGDEIWFSNEENNLYIGHVKKTETNQKPNVALDVISQYENPKVVTIILSNGWKTIETKL